MLRNEWPFGVQDRHLKFKDQMQLVYSALVLMNFYAIVIFQFA